MISRTVILRNGILAVRLQPLVNLVKVDDPSLAWLATWDFPVREFLIDGRKGNVGVLNVTDCSVLVYIAIKIIKN
jgi:hypothetical protein